MSNHYSDPDCPQCGGRGFLYAASMLTLPGERGGRYCDCTMDALKLENMERIWKSLSEVRLLPGMRDKPILKPLLSKSIWITAHPILFKAHLKGLAFNMDSMWDCKVRMDAELLDSWFGTAKAQGVKIFDMEIDKSTLAAIDIRDLVEPPELVAIVLGVKQLPNKEAPNALLEAIAYRRHVGKPTWIVDQPDQQIDQVHHRFYSETLESWLANWVHIQLGKETLTVVSQGYVQTVAEDAGNIDDLVDAEGSDEVDEMLDDLETQEENEAEDEPEEDPDWMATVNTQETYKKKKSKKPWGNKR